MTDGGEHLDDVLGRQRIIKICGLRDPEHAAAAAASGADLIGFIFAPARRRVTADMAAACIAAARTRNSGKAVAAVGVFVDATVEEIDRVVAESGVDLVQLHGSEGPELLEELPVPVVKALRPRPGIAASEVDAEIERFLQATRPPVGFLIDGYAAGSSGGSGARADWELAAELADRRPIFLGGGLAPENVGEAIHQVRPRGVDVSSGVELDGVKDAARIEAFIRAARSAFANLNDVRI